jgi:hypothetical protein
MPVEIHGKKYRTVAERLAEFRGKYPASDGWSIITDVHTPDPEVVIARCEIAHNGSIVATGHAHERWAGKAIQQTSAYEIAETSAVGRALAFMGLSTDEEIASADEVSRAIHDQEAEYDRQVRHMATVRENFDSIAAVKTGIATEDWELALEAWRELGREVQTELWRAPTKGGVFTTQERAEIRLLPEKVKETVK